MTLLTLALIPWIAAALSMGIPAASRRGVAWAAGFAALGVTALALHGAVTAALLLAGASARWFKAASRIRAAGSSPAHAA